MTARKPNPLDLCTVRIRMAFCPSGVAIVFRMPESSHQVRKRPKSVFSFCTYSAIRSRKARTKTILTGKIEEYIYRGNKMKYQRGNKVLEFSYPLLSIPFLNELVVTHDGYIISCADDIHYKYLDKIALPNVNIVKNSFAEILQARNEFILCYLDKELS